MTRAFVVFFLLAFQLPTADAQDDSGAWWNPFSKSAGEELESPEVKSSSFFDRGTSMPKLKLPQVRLWPGEGGSPKSSGTSTFQKMGQSTKKMWTSTVDFLNPFDSSDKPQAEPWNRQPWYQPQSPKSDTDSGGWNWWPWSAEPEPEPPTSVTDFLVQPRPPF